MMIYGRTLSALLFNKYTLAVVFVGLVAFGIYRGVDEIADASRDAGAAEERADGLERDVQERDAAIAGWEARFAEIDAQGRSDDGKLTERTAELKTMADALARQQKELRDAIERLEGLDAVCAAHPVPDAVDGVLGQ